MISEYGLAVFSVMQHRRGLERGVVFNLETSALQYSQTEPC